MEKEIKICLSGYKIIYSFCFILILSLIRGVTYVDEIGVAMEAPMAVLAMVFCADTYVMEISSRRYEVNRLYPMKNRVKSQFRRIVVQELFLFILSMIGYLLFYIQKPIVIAMEQELLHAKLCLFGMYLLAVFCTVWFWGVLSHIIATLCRNMWAGIGGSMILWIGLYSNAGNQLLGKWNVFSFAFRDTQAISDFIWLCGKAVSVGLTVIMVLVFPIVLKKRG